jgi:hypothetical protein
MATISVEANFGNNPAKPFEYNIENVRELARMCEFEFV